MHVPLPPHPPTAPTKEFVEATLEAATASFWQTVAVAFTPECKTGDFPPDADAVFDEACRDALRIWLQFNHPAYDRIGAR